MIKRMSQFKITYEVIISTIALLSPNFSVSFPPQFPDPQQAECFYEPMVLGTIITPDEYLREVINLCTVSTL